MSVNCLNCGKVLSGKYCSECRQPGDTERISWKEILHDIPHVLFHADRGLLHTVIEMTRRPGFTLREYLQGKRIIHFNPFLYLLLMGGICSFLFFTLHIQLPVRDIRMETIELAGAGVVAKYFAAVGVLFILLLTLSDYFIYRKWKNNFPELFIGNTYQAAHILFYTILIFPLLLLQSKSSNSGFDFRYVLITGIIFFLFLTRYQFYDAKHNYILIFKIAVHISLVYLFYNEIIVHTILKYYNISN